nr:FAR1 DNA binding domain, zinc finger, SWIM-type, MULE transposase domain, FHY3/FAR1 family [Tanacetum cinerariifolium]
MAVFYLNQPAISLSEEDGVAVSNSLDVSLSISSNTRCDSFASHDDNASTSNSLKTPKSVIHHEFIDTPGESVYWVPRVFANVLQVLGAVYDNLEECIDIYGKYASEDVCLNTLVPKKNDRQERSLNFRTCGCKAHVVFDMVPNTTKWSDGLAIAAKFPESKHRLCMWHIMQNITSKTEIVAGSWLCSIKAMSTDEGCNFSIIVEEKVKHVGIPKVIDKENQYILRRWTRDLIPPDLRNKKNRYVEKNDAIEKLAMEASIIIVITVRKIRRINAWTSQENVHSQFPIRRIQLPTYAEEMRRLEATGTYTDDEINRLARGGKQRGHIPGVSRVLPARATASPSTPAHERAFNSLHKKVDFMMSLFKSDSKYSDMFSQFESGGASESDGSRDDEEGASHQDDEGFGTGLRSFPGDMSPRNMCHRGTYFLSGKHVGPTVSLGIVAGEGILCERSPSNIPRRQVAEERYPQRQVAGESRELSLGKRLNVVVEVLQPSPLHGHKNAP